MPSFFILIAVVFTLLKTYFWLSEGVCRCKRDMSTKVVIVTGANSGIGKETARNLARRNARVILACRDLNRGKAAAEDIINSTGNKNVVVKKLNLASFASIRQFSEDILSTEPYLHVLINNAAVVTGFQKTQDGLEMQFQTNHFGPFLLTNLLLPLLQKSAPSRIIVVSSNAHYLGKLDLENLNGELYKKHAYWVYCNSKLANLLFVRELSYRLTGTGITVNALHPGPVRTNICRNLSWRWWVSIIPIYYLFQKDPASGAQTSVHLAVSEEVENISGEYFVDCKRAWSTRCSRDRVLARKLWLISEKMTGLDCNTTAKKKYG